MLTQQMSLLVERRIFDSEESLVTSAYRSLLTLQPELKLEIALSLYEEEEISLGRAAEIAGVSREQMKEILAAHGIQRKFAQPSQEQVDKDVRFLLERADRTTFPFKETLFDEIGG